VSIIPQCGEPLTRSTTIRSDVTHSSPRHLQFGQLKRREFITLLGVRGGCLAARGARSSRPYRSLASSILLG
jgi:hypothetical protein